MENESDAGGGPRTIRVGLPAEVLRDFATGLDLGRQLLGPLGFRAHALRHDRGPCRAHEPPAHER